MLLHKCSTWNIRADRNEWSVPRGTLAGNLLEEMFHVEHSRTLCQNPLTCRVFHVEHFQVEWGALLECSTWKT